MATASTVKKAPAVLTRLFDKIAGAPNALISRPAAGVVASKDEPELILIFGWMDAQLQHIHKYTETYHKLYPGATQIIVRSFPNWWWTKEEISIEGILPVAKLVNEAYNPKRTLIHAFSNGGTFALDNVAEGLHRLTGKTDLPLPARTVIFDSCPGDSNFSGGAKAFTGGIKNPIIRNIASALAVSSMTLFWLYSTAAGIEDPFVTLRKHLLDPAFLPPTASRTYIYSKIDELVPAQVVEQHAQESKKLGMDVVLEAYDNSPHVNHLRQNPDRYWAIVKDAWTRSGN
ncbi:hypothetical protein M407DRAFT_105667 [Tulasnella calospora MUT 4182]|uniref:Uncharacterized protein n=1 Tax=Tulasnella calospora MUT 4182 TaxID=1051891 RepID=A0A0C3QVC8_9AGAM|nr:hypothetical protein M407DRAFT_105667 [Tulasnella calospora MUT 4182]